MKSKEELKILLNQKNFNDEEEILDCTEEIEEYIKKVIPKEDD